MSNRSVVVLLIISLSLAGMVLLFERQISQKTEPSADEYKVFKAYSEDEVLSVSLVNGELAVRLERDGDGWRLLSPMTAVADEKRVGALLGQLGELVEVAAPIKAGAGKGINLAEYGLANPSRRIIVSYGGVTDAALSLGRRTEKHDQLYGRLGKENRVIIVNAEATKLLKEIAADQNFYRSRAVFHNKHTKKALKIQVITVDNQGTKSILLQKDEQTERWMLKSPFEDRADQEAVQRLLNECASLQVREFIELPTDPEQMANSLKAYGLGEKEKTAIIALAAEGMQTVLLQLGRIDQQVTYLYALVEEGAGLSVTQPAVVKIPSDFAEALPRSAGLLRDKKFARFEPKTVKEIRLSCPSGVTMLGRAESDEVEEEVKIAAGGEWLIRQPRKSATDQTIVGGFLDELQELTATGFAGAAKTEMGFAKPYVAIEVKTDQKGKDASLQIGALTSDGKNRYARLVGDRIVRQITAESADTLVHDSLYFYERQLAKVGSWNIKTCRISAAGQVEREAVYKEGHWWLKEPAVSRAQEDVVKGVIGIFDPLRAERIVAQQVADSDVETLAGYGLDEPEYRLAIAKEVKRQVSQNDEQSDDEASSEPEIETVMEEHVLSIGKAVDEHAGQYYGRLGGRELIFTLAKEAVGKLGKDWRNKKVLPLMRWQSEQFSKVEIARGSEVLSLEKPRDNWQVLGPKKFWADQEAVKELLIALTELEAGEFGEESTDEQYGLETPTLVVSATLDEASSAEQKNYRFFVGELLEGKGYAIKTDDEDVVRLVGAEKLQSLQQSYLAYRKKQMLSFETKEAQAIEVVKRNGKRSRADRGETGWRLRVPAEEALEPANLEDILEVMSNLRTNKVVADDPGAVKKYGLAKPALTVTVELGGEGGEKMRHSLLIGEEAKDKEDKKESWPHYGALAGDSSVFLVSGADAQRLKKSLIFEQSKRD